MPDNDAAGRTHGLQVAQSLHQTARSIKIVQLPGLAEKGDVSDWLDAGHTTDELIQIVESTDVWTPEQNHTVVFARPLIQINA